MTTQGDKPAPAELKWIEEPNQALIKPPDEFEIFDNQRTFSSIFLTKTRENIFVPLGLIATTACLTMGLVNFKRGDAKKQQLFMRGRVGFQAFTLAAMTIGVMLTGSRRSRGAASGN